jgi:hypothetical protein
MSPTVFYLVFVVLFTILAFLIGTGLAFAAMSGRVEPAESEGDGAPSH